MFHLYDILCARDFNPNARTGFAYSRNNPKFVIREQLRSAIVAFYADRNNRSTVHEIETQRPDPKIKKKTFEYVYQCKDCLTVYDNSVYQPEYGIEAGTDFESLPHDYKCYLCEGAKSNFKKIDKSKFCEV